jgi:hypothetical protein
MLTHGLLRCVADATDAARRQAFDWYDDLVRGVPPSLDLAALLGQFANVTTDRTAAREAVDHALHLCSERPENLFGSRSRVVGEVASALSRFDSGRAVEVLEDATLGVQVRVLPDILTRALGTDPAELDESLSRLLLRRRLTDFGAQAVLLGAAIPAIEEAMGPAVVVELLELIVDARKL